MCVQGVSTRKVKAISEELCGQEFSAPPLAPSTSDWMTHTTAATRPVGGCRGLMKTIPHQPATSFKEFRIKFLVIAK
jgi:hypothetical protein